MEVVWTNSFKRAFKKITKKNPQLQNEVVKVLKLLATDPFAPTLKSHKLTGSLKGLWSCSVTYDCRIIFAFSKNGTTLLVLIDLGSHNEVY